MIKKPIAIVLDCRTQNSSEADYYTINIWGKPCFQYVCDSISSINGYAKYLLTDSPKVKYLLADDSVCVVNKLDDIKERIFALVSGTALMLKTSTILNVLKGYSGGVIS